MQKDVIYIDVEDDVTSITFENGSKVSVLTRRSEVLADIEDRITH